MTLDEAIEHCEEKALGECGQCAREHAQLSAWLRELRRLRKGKQCPATHGEVIAMCCDACERTPAAHFSGTMMGALTAGWAKSDRGWVCPRCGDSLKKPKWENPDGLPTCRTCLNEPQVRKGYCSLANGVVELDKPHKPGSFKCYLDKKLPR